MRIDVHAHYWTDDYLDLLVDLGKADADGGTAARRRRRSRCAGVNPKQIEIGE
jgi:hypothetical protein